jgi:phytoene synthase
MRRGMSEALIEMLAPPARLALVYAPLRARQPWLALLALDAKLAALIRGSREPMLGQIRLAWWRERLAAPRESWPQGEPVLAALRAWPGDPADLVPLVDGWEALLAEPLDMAGFAEGRAGALSALGVALGCPSEAIALRARRWALADLAAHLSDPAQAAEARRLAAAIVTDAPLPRAMRPLVVLDGLGAGPAGLPGLMRAVRLGLVGR